MSESIDVPAEWRAARDRVVKLLRDASEDQLALPVPACPGWTPTQLVAHVIGLDADVLAGGEAEDHNDRWTQAHVDARAGASVEDLAAEWEGLSADLMRYLAETDPRPLGDLIIHEQDLRGALGVSGAQDTPGLAFVRDSMLGRLGAAVDELDDAPGPLVLRSPEFVWSSGEGEPGLVLEASGFDLFRAVTTRRSEAQLRSWTTSGDVGPYLTVFGGLGDLPGDDRTE